MKRAESVSIMKHVLVAFFLALAFVKADLRLDQQFAAPRKFLQHRVIAEEPRWLNVLRSELTNLDKAGEGIGICFAFLPRS